MYFCDLAIIRHTIYIILSSTFSHTDTRTKPLHTFKFFQFDYFFLIRFKIPVIGTFYFKPIHFYRILYLQQNTTKVSEYKYVSIYYYMKLTFRRSQY